MGFLPDSNTRYAGWPMTGRWGPLGTGCAPHAAQGALQLVNSVSFPVDTAANYDVTNEVWATRPVPFPYAQNLTFVAYFTYDDDTLFAYDEGDWEVRVETCPDSTISATRYGRTLYDPWEEDSVQWARLSDTLVGMTTNDDYLTARRYVLSGAQGDDVVKGFELEKWNMPGDEEHTVRHFRARVWLLDGASGKLSDKATLVIETWANQAIWNSDSNPYLPGPLNFPDPAWPTEERWRFQQKRLRTTDLRGGPGVTNRDLEIWSKTR